MDDGDMDASSARVNDTAGMGWGSRKCGRPGGSTFGRGCDEKKRQQRIRWSRQHRARWPISAAAMAGWPGAVCLGAQIEFACSPGVGWHWLLL